MLEAACDVFGERGYAGATTDAIAEAAGVSQAYVVRTFGSKETLFAEAAERAITRIMAVFRDAAVTSQGIAERTPETIQRHLGQAYVGLVADRGILLTSMHLFTLGHHPRFGPLARRGFLDVYRVLREDVGLSGPDAERFLARGMLINVILASHLPALSASDADAAELLACAFEGETDEFLAAAAAY